MMNEDAETTKDIATQSSSGRDVEVTSLLYEMHESFRRMVKEICQSSKVEPGEALKMAVEAFAPYKREHVQKADRTARRTVPVMWIGLQLLAMKDPETMLQAWEEIKQAARDDLESGHLAARFTEGMSSQSTPQQRAQFLALREALMRDWQPRPGIEQMLIDSLAQSQTLYAYWLLELTCYANGEMAFKHAEYDKHGIWSEPRISRAEAMEQAAAMVDRFNRIVLRILRNLRDLRRYAPQVTIQSAEQVNIGGQQINVARERD